MQQTPLQVVHHLPGRTRLFWPGLTLNHQGARRLTHHLAGRVDVHRARADTRSGRLLVHHDRSLDPARILEIVQEALQVITGLEEAGNPPFAPEPEDQPMTRQFSRVGGVGGMLLFLLLRRRIKGPSGLASSPVLFNLMAATALAAGYPNFKNGLRYVVGRKSSAHDLLLGVATLTLLFLGEGFLGLTVVLLVSVTDLVQAMLWQRTRTICPVAADQDRAEPDYLTQAARAYAEWAAGMALAGGVVAGLAARNLRRPLAVLLAANPSGAGLVAPAALTAAAARAQSAGVAFTSRGAVAALSRVNTLVTGPGPDEEERHLLEDAGMAVVPVHKGGMARAAKRLQAGDTCVAVLGGTPEDLAAMRRSYLALARRDAPDQVLATASVYLPPGGLGPLVSARRLARDAARRAGQGLTLVRAANLGGMLLAGCGYLSPARGTLWAHLTSLAALLVAVDPPVRRAPPPTAGGPEPDKGPEYFPAPRDRIWMS